MELANPFQILTLIVAPAILTNSSALLSLSTSNRFARVVDRSRAVYTKLKDPGAAGISDEEQELYRKQLPLLGRRSLHLVKALTWFYVSLGSFAATAFVSIIGAFAAALDYQLPFRLLTGLAFVSGASGVVGLVSGASLLVREMWMALDSMEEEVRLAEFTVSQTLSDA